MRSICLGRESSKQKNRMKTFENYVKTVVYVTFCEYGIPFVFMRCHDVSQDMSNCYMPGFI